MARILKRPNNGTGAGINPHKRPKTIDSSTALAVLSKPFKVPIKRSTTYSLDNGRHQRRAKKYVDYAAMDTGVDVDDEVYQIDANGNGSTSVIIKKKGALLSRRFLNSNIDVAARKKFVVPFADKSKLEEHAASGPPAPLGTRKKPILLPRPLHDPTDKLAIVLYDPTVDVFPKPPEPKEDEANKGNIKPSSSPQSSSSSTTSSASSTPAPDGDEPPQSLLLLLTQSLKKKKKHHKSLAEILGIETNPEDRIKNAPDVPVIVDPKLAKILRPHQIEGVKFLYRCTAGLIDYRAKGCIMADEMGLGKTLQCIALMWTLLRQGPRGKRMIDKAIVVCPSSLVSNWANEIVKWLGEGTITPLPIDGKSTKGSTIGEAISQWSLAQGRNIVRPVLIISYETLRRNVDRLKNTEVGLLLADEGHRLKNGDSLTFTALDSINCERRVILSGTPIQNDLSEYFSLLSFANPGLLGSRNEFRKNFEIPILRGRDADATDKEKEKGDSKLADLSEIVSKFIIRRTNDILSKYLPVKYEHVIFCNLTPMQKSIYNHFVTSPEIGRLIKGVDSQPLKAIGLLKKLCSHPNLLNLPEDIEGSEEFIPDDYQDPLHGGGRNKEIQTWFSGKFSILERFLAKMQAETTDKVVLISNYTQTLDLIERMCRHRRYGCLRLDGTLNIKKRQKLVDRFNDPEGPEFVFLLSSKAGGCGINLIGANRLVLIDPDWNPASDQQALARVWRDGQKKTCFVYRLISTGTIEEKILQRQSMKLSLSSCVVDEKEDVERIFSGDNLKQLFQFNTKVECDTHNTFNCKRCKDGRQVLKPPAMLYGDQTTWNHVNHEELKGIHDDLLRNEYNFDEVSYAFQYISH